MSRRGFTLTEFIVVIAIISIISAIALGAFGEYRERAQARTAVEQLGQLETALRTYRQFELNVWPTVGGTGTNINSIIAGSAGEFPGFAQYFSGVDLAVLDRYAVSYVNEGSVNDPCNDVRSGVLIRLAPDISGQAALDELYAKMNEMIDGDDPATDCGKLRQGGPSDSVYYVISPSTTAN